MEYPCLERVKKMIVLAEERLQSLKVLAEGLTHPLNESTAIDLLCALELSIVPLNNASETIQEAHDIAWEL